MPFFFGGAISQLTVDIGKYSIGRLRPHFITVCVPDATKCSSNVGAYIEEDICTGTDKDAIEEARYMYYKFFKLRCICRIVDDVSCV